MVAVTGSIRVAPRTAPLNGLPPWRPYVYRGTGSDTLTAFMDEDERGPGRPPTEPCGTRAAYGRHLRHGERPCAACVQAARENAARRAGRDPALIRPRRCGSCGYLTSTPGHQIACRSGV